MPVFLAKSPLGPVRSVYVAEIGFLRYDVHAGDYLIGIYEAPRPTPGAPAPARPSGCPAYALDPAGHGHQLDVFPTQRDAVAAIVEAAKAHTWTPHEIAIVTVPRAYGKTRYRWDCPTCGHLYRGSEHPTRERAAVRAAGEHHDVTGYPAVLPTYTTHPLI